VICVYKIQNKVNTNCYIGSTVNSTSRKSTHFLALKNGKHHSIVLQRAYDKYGIDNFEFIVIEECTRENKQEREQFYIDTLQPEYNTSKSAKCPMLGRKHSDKTKALFKLRKVRSGKEIHSFGTKWSEEHREKQRLARTGLKRSDEFKKTQSDNANKLNLAQYLVDKGERKVIDDLGNVYNSLKEASEKNGVAVQTVCDILKGRHSKTRKGRSFKYYEDT
jgi:group I intron endonuclease